MSCLASLTIDAKQYSNSLAQHTVLGTGCISGAEEAHSLPATPSLIKKIQVAASGIKNGQQSHKRHLYSGLLSLNKSFDKSSHSLRKVHNVGERKGKKE